MVNTAAATTSVTRIGETELEGDWFIKQIVGGEGAGRPPAGRSPPTASEAEETTDLVVLLCQPVIGWEDDDLSPLGDGPPRQSVDGIG